MAFTDGDKQWISEQLSAQLSGQLSGLFGKLTEYMDGRLAAQNEYIDERTRDMETRLLSAFADYHTNANIRFRKLEADASNLDTSSTLRLGELERQVAELQAKVIQLQSRLPAA